ncbi:MAG: ZIP family metal transporter [Candidatus Xenobia bacterium]
MHPQFILAIALALVAGFGDVLGGWLSVVRHLSRRTLTYATALAAGFMIGVALLDRIPDIYSGSSANSGAMGVLVGFLLIYVMENFFATHAHAHGDEAAEHHHDASLHGHGYLEEAMHDEHGHALMSQMQAEDCAITHTASVAAQWGLLLHTAFDGVAIGAGFAVSAQTGVLMFMAVICHKVPEGFSLASLLLAAGRTRRAAFRSALGLGLSTVVGAIAALLSPHLSEKLPHLLLALATGSFLYIATCDLLPATNRAGDRRANLIVIGGVLLFGLSDWLMNLVHLH